MNNKELINKILLITLLTGFSMACSQKRYVVTNIEGSRVLMDSTWDVKINPEIKSTINTYKHQLEAEMNEVIGESAQTMRSEIPQSLLTNLTSDAMKQYGDQYAGKPVDFAVTNVHGLRAELGKGKITIENMFEIYSFDNLIVILNLDGKSVKELFGYYAKNEGEGVSSDVSLKIKNKKISSLSIGGKPVDDNKIYRVVTLDYLAEGNSGMVALKNAKNTIVTGTTLRDVMIGYVKKCTAAGQKIDSRLDNRLIIEK